MSLIIGLFLIKAHLRSPLVNQLASGVATHPLNRRVMSLGGGAVVISFLAAIWAMCALEMIPEANFRLLAVFSLGILAMFVLGVYDDIFDCRARNKLVLQVFIASSMYYFGLHIDRVGDWTLHESLSFLLSVLWMVGMANSVNLIDGLDGLAGGVVFLSTLTLFFIYFGRDLFLPSFFSLVLAGSLLGFLILNFPPAKIVLGDTGSLPIGLLIGMITLLPPSQGFFQVIYFLVPFTALLYPVLDTANAFFRRALKGQSPFARDVNHFHHRLVRLGLSPLQVLLLLMGVCIYFNGVSLVPIYYINLVPNFVPRFAVFILVNVITLIWVLDFFERRQGKKNANSKS